MDDRFTLKKDPQFLFQDVEPLWDLDSLYDDLEDIKRQPLTTLDKACLRGLLSCGSRTKLAAELQEDPEQLREYLQQNLYPHLATLTGYPEITSSKIPQWLTDKGYRVPSSVQESSTPEDSQKHFFPHFSRMTIAIAGLALTVVTGVVTEVLGGVFTSWFTDPTPASTAISSNLSQSGASVGSASTVDKFSDVSVPSGIFNYGGSTTWATIRAKVDPIVKIAHPDFKLRYVDPISGSAGSGSGIKMLLNNQLAFAQSSRPLHDSEYQEAKTQGVQLKAIPVAIDGIAVIVNPNLPLQGLTVTQLRDIYLGRITNWKEVGGPNVAIVPYSRDADAGGTVDFFVENLLDKQAFGKPVQIVTNTTLAVRAVEKNLGAIYYASAPSIVPQCQVKPLAIAKQPNEFIPPYQEPYVPSTDCPNHRNQVNAEAFQTGSYPITRRLFVIIKENDQVDQQAGEAYAQLMLSHEGQRLIEEVGFVPLQ